MPAVPASGTEVPTLPGRLMMHLQPVVVLGTGAVHRFEALARLVGTDGALMQPASFLPGLTDADRDLLLRDGLDQVLGHLAIWAHDGVEITASINISTESLRHPGCATWVTRALDRHRVPPGQLLLEVLEDGAIDSDAQRDTIAVLHERGVGLVMDDMGVGHSTLARLTAFPFLGAKVDRSYVLAIDDDPVVALRRIDALVTLSHELGWDLAVEGIETLSVAEAVVGLGVARAQGYLFARPMPADEVPAFVAAFRSPVRPGVVTTYLGALAYHLEPTRAAVHTLEDCPVTVFLAREVPDEHDVRRWHEAQHLPERDLVSGSALVGWLRERATTTS